MKAPRLFAYCLLCDVSESLMTLMTLTLMTGNDRDLNDRISLFSLSHAARYSERSSDSGQNADGYLKNCFPSVRFHFVEC